MHFRVVRVRGAVRGAVRPRSGLGSLPRSRRAVRAPGPARARPRLAGAHAAAALRERKLSSPRQVRSLESPWHGEHNGGPRGAARRRNGHVGSSGAAPHAMRHATLGQCRGRPAGARRRLVARFRRRLREHWACGRCLPKRPGPWLAVLDRRCVWSLQRHALLPCCKARARPTRWRSRNFELLASELARFPVARRARRCVARRQETTEQACRALRAPGPWSPCGDLGLPGRGPAAAGARFAWLGCTFSTPFDRLCSSRACGDVLRSGQVHCWRALALVLDSACSPRLYDRHGALHTCQDREISSPRQLLSLDSPLNRKHNGVLLGAGRARNGLVWPGLS